MKVGQAYTLERPELTVLDIIKIRKGLGEFAGYRLGSTPFGVDVGAPQKIYIGAAVPWKGKKFLDVRAFREFVIGKIGVDKGNKLADGLEKARNKAVSLKGQFKGTVVYNGKLYPRFCIELKKAWGKA